MRLGSSRGAPFGLIPNLCRPDDSIAHNLINDTRFTDTHQQRLGCGVTETPFMLATGTAAISHETRHLESSNKYGGEYVAYGKRERNILSFICDGTPT